MNVGSLFTGIRGLDLGLEAAGLTTAWACEIDQDCRRVIERTAPGLHVYPDIREIDATATPVDVLVGGFPCPDFSVAGKRLMFAGERAQLWFEFARCVRLLRPRHVVVENVPGLLACLGVVLADLAEAGYVGRWFCLRAADVGAPHRRERVFILATDAECGGVDADGRVRRGDPGGGDPAGRAALPQGPEVARAADALSDRASAPADSERLAGSVAGERYGGPGEGGEPRARGDAREALDGAAGRDRRRGEDAADSDSVGYAIVGQPESARVQGEPWRVSDRRGPHRRLDDAAEAAPDAASLGRDRRPSGEVGYAKPGEAAERPEGDADPRNGGRVEWGAYEPAIRQWEQLAGAARPEPLKGSAAPADAASSGRRGQPEREDGIHDGKGEAAERSQGDADATDGSRVEWGAYGPAVRRWELLLGRPAPRPTDDRGRLNPGFVEWMMGFPDGWTDGEKRTARLRMLGNAVQVQVAEVVGRVLLEEAA